MQRHQSRLCVAVDLPVGKSCWTLDPGYLIKVSDCMREEKEAVGQVRREGSSASPLHLHLRPSASLTQ